MTASYSQPDQRRIPGLPAPGRRDLAKVDAHLRLLESRIAIGWRRDLGTA